MGGINRSRTHFAEPPGCELQPHSLLLNEASPNELWPELEPTPELPRQSVCSSVCPSSFRQTRGHRGGSEGSPPGPSLGPLLLLSSSAPPHPLYLLPGPSVLHSGTIRPLSWEMLEQLGPVVTWAYCTLHTLSLGTPVVLISFYCL